VLNLDKLTWSKPKTDGKYPSPKAAASLVSHNQNSLILFGGYSHPYQYAINQQVNFYNELHSFCTRTHLWTSKVFVEDVPKLAGHSASLLNKSHMIIFGGCVGVLTNKTNQVWCLSVDRSEFKWLKRRISGPEPLARYGHAQINIDNERLLILGGCGGPNQLFEDVWILVWPCDMTLDAFWQKVSMLDSINGPAQLHCVALVRCGEKIVTLGKPKKQKLDEKDVKCICSVTNVQSGFDVPKNADSEERTAVAGRDDTSHLNMSKAQRNKIKRLEVLQNIASRYKKSSTSADDYRHWKDSDRAGKAPIKLYVMRANGF
jgi:F-box protein 42